MSNACIINKILLDKNICCNYEELKAIDHVILNNNEKLTIHQIENEIENTLFIILSLIVDLRKLAA